MLYFLIVLVVDFVPDPLTQLCDDVFDPLLSRQIDGLIRILHQIIEFCGFNVVPLWAAAVVAAGADVLSVPDIVEEMNE